MSNISEQVQKFWDSPEGKGSKIINYILLGAAGIAFYKYLPEIIKFADNMFHLAGVLLVLTAIGYCFWDKDIRTSLFIGYKALMSKFVRFWVTIDPLATLETCLSMMKKNLEKVSFHITNLNGQLRHLNQIIIDKKKEVEKAYQAASFAKEQNNENMMLSKARIAASTYEVAKDYELLRNQMDVTVRVLKKMESSCQIIIEETTHNLNVQREKYQIISTGHKALKGAMSILSNSKEKQIFDETMDFMQRDMNMKLGEMERVMDLSKSVIESIDLNNLMMDHKGLSALEEWEKQADSILLGKPKAQPVTIQLQNTEQKAISKYGL